MPVSKSQVSSFHITWIGKWFCHTFRLRRRVESTKTSCQTTFENTCKIRLKIIIRIDTIKIKCTCNKIFFIPHKWVSYSDHSFPPFAYQIILLSTPILIISIHFLSSLQCFPVSLFNHHLPRLTISSLFLLATHPKRNNLLFFISSIISVTHVLKK